MSYLMTILIGLSFAVSVGLSIYYLKRQTNWLQFILQIIALVFYFVLLHVLFDFPAISPTPRGGGEQELYRIIILYICMLLGMLAQYAYNRFEQPKKLRKKFDLGLFIAPIFTSPIIFIPLLAALQNAVIDLNRLNATRIMVFLVAFENGFFWKAYFDQKRKETETNAK